MSRCFTCENEVSDTSNLTFSGAHRMSGWYPRRMPGLTRHPRPSRYMSQAENRLLFSRKRCFSHVLRPGARYRWQWAGARVTALCLGYKTSLVGVAGQKRGRCINFTFFFGLREVVCRPPTRPARRVAIYFVFFLNLLIAYSSKAHGIASTSQPGASTPQEAIP